MVSKAKSIKGSVASIAYIQNDKELGDAIELIRNGIISHEPKEIMDEFRLLQEANLKCEKNTISIVISPSSEKEFTKFELKEIGKRHLDELGLGNNQYLMTLHQSTGKSHIHIIANRIDEKGKAVKDNFISLKSQRISEKIAQENGLMTAKEIKKVNELSLTPIKEDLKKAHIFAVKHSKTFQDYKDLMKSKGVKVDETINKKGELQGFRLIHKESALNFKSSELGKNFGVKNLLENRIKLPTLTPSLHQIALKISKLIIRESTRGFGY